MHNRNVVLNHILHTNFDLHEKFPEMSSYFKIPSKSSVQNKTKYPLKKQIWEEL